MFDIAEKMRENKNFALDWAYKVKGNIELSETEKEMSASIDVWAKEIGNGQRPVIELSAFIQKVVQPVYSDAPFELLSTFLNTDSIGEFDNFKEIEDAKNTLQAYESARAVGNVYRTFIDYASLAPTFKHIQLETEVTLEKLRKGGYKTVAELTNFAEIALRNKMFAEVMSIINAAVTSGDNYGSGALAEAGIKAIADYINEMGGGIILASQANVNAIVNLVPVDEMSDAMKEALNRVGSLPVFRGVPLVGIKRTAKLADGTLPISTTAVYGVAGIIGDLVQRGDLRVLSQEDINAEKIHLKFTGVEFGVVVRNPELMYKHAIS